MMRRGPLADNPIETLLDAAAQERIGGVIELHGPVEGQVYLVEGDVYLADVVGRPPLERRLLEAGLLTDEQIARHTEPGDDSPYLALALDTDATINEHAISDWLFDLSAATLAEFIGVTEGEYELDPYGSHPAGILASWSAAEVFERARVLQLEQERRAEAERAEAERLEAERKAEIERREAEQRADAERARAAQREAERAGERAAASPEGGSAAPDPETADDIADLPPPPAPATAAPSEDSQVLIVTSDAVPDGVARIELTPIEWRVVVLAARGMSLGDLARRLDVDREEVGGVVDSLSARGLLATVG